MENSNTNQPVGQSSGKNICGGLIILAIGILIGILGAKYVWHGSSGARAGNPVALAAPALPTASATSQAGEWNPFDQIRNMQTEIDQVFQRSSEDIRMNPTLKVFQKEPGYSLTMDVRDLKDQYQVRAFLPDTKASDVKVNLNGNQLKVDVMNKTTEKEMAKNSEITTSELGHYEEVVQLAGGLKDDQMKVQRNGHELIITVPKV